MPMHNRASLFFRTMIGYTTCFFVGIFCFLPMLTLVAILPEHSRYRSKWLFRFLHCTYQGVVKALLGPISIQGLEYMPSHPAIFVANHQSSLDIPVLGSLLRGSPHTWYVLERFSHTPILGFFVRRMCISVDQECSMKASRSLVRGLRLVEQEGLHTLIFPEGGRYIDGKIHDFFLGFAIIAKRTGRPVIPVMMYNLGKVYPPKSFLVHRYPIKVIIGQPFMLEETETLEDFSQRVHRWFKERSQV